MRLVEACTGTMALNWQLVWAWVRVSTGTVARDWQLVWAWVSTGTRDWQLVYARVSTGTGTRDQQLVLVGCLVLLALVIAFKLIVLLETVGVHVLRPI